MTAPGRGECGAPVRAGDPSECEGPARFAVRYTLAGRVVDEHRACFRHGLAEVDRHRAANGSAEADLVELDPPPGLAHLLR